MNNLKPVALIFVVLLLLGGAIWLNRWAQMLQPVAGNDRFGLAFISAPDALASEARYEGALIAGARWNRWPLYWHWVAQGGYVGPHQDGRHDYDALIAADLGHGLTPLVILMGTPAEQAGLPVEPAVVNDAGEEFPLRENPISVSTATLPPAGMYEPIFADGTDDPVPGKAVNPANAWAMFVFNTADRYRPGGRLARQQGWSGRVGVRHWEIWNEPDFDSFWGGTVEAYYRLLEVAYKTIKTVDPQATVVLGGLAFYEEPNWLPQLLRLAGGDPAQTYFDVLSLHHYWSIYNSEQRLLEMRATLDTYGLSQVPIWITESGVSVWDDYPATAHAVSPDTPWRGTTAEQAAYVIEHSALALYHGVERYYHFMLHDDCGDGPSSAYGLRQNFSPHVCNPADGRPRPAYAAYQLAARQFEGVLPLWRNRRFELDQVAFYRPADRARVIVAWATQGITTTLTLTATGDSAQLYHIGGPGAFPSSSLQPVEGRYTLSLPPATNQNALDPGDTTYHIGGQPLILIERDILPPTAILTLPPLSPPNFTLTWQGEDEGSGVAGYDVWFSQNGGPLQLWLANTTATQADYTGQIGATYGFAVRARDRAGNEAPAPRQAQLTTRIVAGPAVTGVVLGPGGRPVRGATVTITGPNTQQSLITDEAGRWTTVALPAGNYTFQAEAAGYGRWPSPRSLAPAETGVITLTLAPLANAISSGDFEGEQVWRVWDWLGRVNLSNDAFDGQGAVRLGESQGDPYECPAGQTGQQWLVRQTFDVPAGAAAAGSFLYKISTSATNPEGWLAVAVVAGEDKKYLIPPGTVWQATGWTLHSLDLLPWQDQTVTLQFETVRCSEQPFKVTLDRVNAGW